jgi:hypothetical protein
VPCRPQSSWLSRSGVRVGGFWRFKMRARVASTFASPLWARSPPDRSVPVPGRMVGLGRLACLVGRSRLLPCVLALLALATVAGVFSAARVVSHPCRSATPPRCHARRRVSPRSAHVASLPALVSLLPGRWSLMHATLSSVSRARLDGTPPCEPWR